MARIRMEVLAVAVLCIFPMTLTSADTNDYLHHNHGWGPWGKWSECNAECGTGVMTRDRQCTRDTHGCHGQSVQFKLCYTQECSAGQTSLKERLCSAHDGIDIGYGRYRWAPYMLFDSRCELTCRARGQTFYITFKDPVSNGTLCKRDGSAVCVQGTCKNVGCDGIAGSRTKRDVCGECGGDGSTCKIMAGVKDESELDYGYSFVHTLPAGSTYINVTQLARSRNYLALKIKDGPYFMNGNRRLSRQGSIEGAGTVFHYHRRHTRKCPGECVLSDGPTTQDVDIMVLAFGQNGGIMYRYAQSYIQPNSVPTLSSYALEDISPTFTDLVIDTSADDNGTAITVTSKSDLNISEPNSNDTNIKVDGAIIVQDAFLGPETETAPTVVSEISEEGKDTDSNFEAHTSAVSNGGRKMPGYTQSFDFMDKMKERHQNNGQHDHGQQYTVPQNNGGQDNYGQQNNEYQSGDGEFVNAPLADTVATSDNVMVVNPEEPVYVSGSSDTQPRLYQWKTVGYSKCSQSCGTGYKRPEVRCVVYGSYVLKNKCLHVRQPNRNQVVCNTHACPTNYPARWETSIWSSCSVTCGSGEMRRHVRCVQDTGRNFDIDVRPENCAYSAKPAVIQSCQTEECYEWNAGQWSRCSSTCGSGTRTRSVRCTTTSGRPIVESACRLGPKPVTTSPCSESACDNNVHVGDGSDTVWYHTQWPTQCPVDCGDGSQTRKIACLRTDGYVTSELSCSFSMKPQSSKSCRKREQCTAYWFTGPWNECNATCGTGSQIRSMICVRKDNNGVPVVVSDYHCDEEDKPQTTTSCHMADCRPEWFMSEWRQCSVTCGRGVTSRDVRCLDGNYRLTSGCDPALQPETSEPCVRDTCSIPPPQEHRECKDKYTHCIMVLKTTLCKYRYYKDLCCESCLQAGFQ